MDKIVVNADDLGKDEMTNEAIKESFAKGFISSATIMANMPGFEEAIEIVHQYDLQTNIGIHLNLSEGQPLTTPILSVPSICDEKGNFCFRMKRHSTFISPFIAKALYIEMKAQIEHVIKAGIVPSHFDSHDHTHTIWPIASQVIALAKEFNIFVVRLSANVVPPPSRLKRIYKSFLNNRLKYNRLAKTTYFGSVWDYERNIDKLKGCIECMVHPAFNEKGDLIDRCDEKNEVKRSLYTMIKGLDVMDRMSSYSDIVFLNNKSGN